MRRRLLPTLIAGLTALTALVTAAPTSTAATGDWPTDHGDNLRSGHIAGTASYTSLRTGWTRSLDGAVYGSPIVIGGRVVVATENNTVYSIDPTTGAVRWSRHLRSAITDTSVLACPGSISPTGITSTPAYDPVTGRIFVVTVTSSPSTGVTHELWALRPGDGVPVLDKRVEVPGTDPRAQQQRAALAVDRGNVYVAFGGLAGDCGSYKGAVLSLFANGASGGVAYVVPTAREAGIWAPGGPVVAADGTVFVAVGNGASTSGAYDRSDSVTRLTGRMGVVDWFAPTSWASDNARDLDLGSMTPALTSNGMVLQVGKSGTGYTARAGHLGGIGGQLATASLCPSYGVSAVTGTTVYLPCTTGVTRVDVDAAGGIHRGWTQGSVTGSPVAGPGALYAIGNGRLLALAGGTGAVLGSIAVPTASRFATPALSGNRAFVGTLSGVTSVLVG
ncbi:PQQ-binding-like beta-propeller repeat protein [Lapillicoccus jejuensis]|uniref:Putative pyrroloquinoline-quinone binding quinoprotein n=1 Tax=Lapillicoccus jejuensis TaxID=402171 RepID=A0A542E3H7_9MICO|nr:PQQ-binding-like beta-propeller repeat protein [Lapillicoccus jejuensis]TQJ09888.1 putative pyrroloquinoline-quinone binding quinoprotein [Lapillicoccus jejuensis]